MRKLHGAKEHLFDLLRNGLLGNGRFFEGTVVFDYGMAKFVKKWGDYFNYAKARS